MNTASTGMLGFKIRWKSPAWFQPLHEEGKKIAKKMRNLFSSNDAVPDDAVEAFPDDAIEAVSDDTLEVVPDDAVEALPDDAIEAVPDDAVEAVPDVAGHGAIRPIVPVQVSAGGIILPVYAMLDCAATCSAISLDLAHRLDARIDTLSINLRTFGYAEVSQRDVTSFTVTDLFETFELEIKNALVHEQLSTENESPPRKYMTRRLEHLNDVRFAHTWMVPLASRSGKSTEPIAILKKFGWALAGPPFEKFEDEIIPRSSLCILDSELA